MLDTLDLVSNSRHDPNIANFIENVISGNIVEVKPVINLAVELGFSYPQLENLLGMDTQEVIAMLEALARESILEKRCEDKLLFCPYCHSLNLRPALRCPKCGSGNVAKGRVLEHFSCTNIAMEAEFLTNGRYMCPKCFEELRFLGTDYRSLGINYKCQDCGYFSNGIAFKWQCLKCQLFFPEDETEDELVFSYRINEDTRSWLEFGFKPRTMFIEFLKKKGYEIFEQVKISGRKSRKDHIIDILARRDDGFITYIVGIDIVIDKQGSEISLEEIFKFDDKTYDIGIYNKVLLAIPTISDQAMRFAQRQNIIVLKEDDLESLINTTDISVPSRAIIQPFEVETEGDFLNSLEKMGYKFEENVNVQGVSGVEHVIDILAQSDDGFIKHKLIVGIMVEPGGVSLETISSFDAKAHDIDIRNKVVLVSPGLNPEVVQFAKQKEITIFEVGEAGKLK